MLLATLFLLAAGDTAQCLVYQRLDSTPQYIMACAAIPAPADPDSIMAHAPSIEFRRDGVPVRSPYDAAGMQGATLTLCARLDGPEWQTCGVWLDGRLIGTFVRPADSGIAPRRRERVEDGGRQ